MKITATVPTEAFISDDEVISITIKKLCEKYELHPELYIEDGELKRDYEEGCGGHSWTETETFRVATTEDIAILPIIKDLKSEYGGWFDSKDISYHKIEKAKA